MPNFKPSQRGFTLIEMSIVLVIIGLIVGGILKGQEVIESARQKNMASLYDQIRAANGTFLDRYRALAGDYREAATKINSDVVNGDGNGFIGTMAANMAGLGTTVANAGEQLNFFNGLIAAGLFGGGQVVTGSTAATGFSGGATQSALPNAPWSNTGLMVAHGTHGGPTGDNASKTAPWLRLQTFATAGTLTASEAALTGPAAFQVDLKFDDGLPMTGRIRTIGVLNPGVCGEAGTNAFSPVTASDARQCDLLFAID